jgi:hypothetical protein
MGKQTDALEHVSDPATQLVRRNGAGILSVDQHLSRGRLDQSIHHLERRRFAGPRSTQQHHELPLGDLQRQAINGSYLAVAARQLLRLDHLEIVPQSIEDLPIFDSGLIGDC